MLAMKRRAAGLSILGLALVLALALGLGAEPGWAQRISFVIATGPTGGTYFPIGQAIAGIISHPASVDRCDTVGVCGPDGLIASVRTSPGSVANAADIDAGRVDSGLVQSDVVAEAVKGRGAFHSGALKNLRVIASLFPEEIHVVVAKSAHIKSIAGLRGKRVSVGDPDSGTAVTARAVLSAWHLSERDIRVRHLASDVAASELDSGRLDAFFFVGGAPVELIADLTARGRAVLVPLDGRGRKRLIASVPGLSADVIPSGAYPNIGEVPTASIHALWVVNKSKPDDVIYGVTRALFNPANRAALLQSHPSAKFIRLDTAADDLPAPLHPGAARFYRKMHVNTKRS